MSDTRVTQIATMGALIAMLMLGWHWGKRSADLWWQAHQLNQAELPVPVEIKMYDNALSPAGIGKPQAQQPDMVQTAPVQVTLKQFQYCIDLALVMHGTCDYTVLAHPVIVFKKYRYEICGSGVKSDCVGEQPVATAHPLKLGKRKPAPKQGVCVGCTLIDNSNEYSRVPR